MALINLKDYKKQHGLKNMSDTVRAILIDKAGWKNSGGYSYCGTNGIDFWGWHLKQLRSGKTRRIIGTRFMLPVRKAKEIVLDTDAGLLIFEGILAVNVK
jgi:hypothetical protein